MIHDGPELPAMDELFQELNFLYVDQAVTPNMGNPSSQLFEYWRRTLSCKDIIIRPSREYILLCPDDDVLTSKVLASILDQVMTTDSSGRNSAEQNTAALIASSMNSEYEDDWSTPPSSYRDSHTPLTSSSVSSSSVDHKPGFGENVINNQMVHNGSTICPMEVNEEVGFSEENLRLLTFNEYEELRNYTDLDVLEAAAPTLLNEINSVCQSDGIIPPVTQEFKSNDITPAESKAKKSPSKKKKKPFPNAAVQFQSGSTLSTMEASEDGCLNRFNEESSQPFRAKKIKKKKVVPITNCQEACSNLPGTLGGPSNNAQPPLNNGSLPFDGKCDPVIGNQQSSEVRQICINSTASHLGSENAITVAGLTVQETNYSSTANDLWTTVSPKKDENILKKKFVKKTITSTPSNSAMISSAAKNALVLKPRKELRNMTPNSKAAKAPSYLTLFPMRCKEYPMIYSCNHCAGIFTSIRGGQQHECVKKRRGRKLGTKLKQSYSNNYSDWSQV